MNIFLFFDSENLFKLIFSYNTTIKSEILALKWSESLHQPETDQFIKHFSVNPQFNTQSTVRNGFCSPDIDSSQTVLAGVYVLLSTNWATCDVLHNVFLHTILVFLVFLFGFTSFVYWIHAQNQISCQGLIKCSEILFFHSYR